jgi:hypothetical protein
MGEGVQPAGQAVAVRGRKSRRVVALMPMDI